MAEEPPRPASTFVLVDRDLTTPGKMVCAGNAYGAPLQLQLYFRPSDQGCNMDNTVVRVTQERTGVSITMSAIGTLRFDLGENDRLWVSASVPVVCWAVSC